jgi:muramidase (phage lysozyme)
LFKRLESSGFAFLQSLDRHILRNYVYLHAIANQLDIPIGTQNAALLDMRDVDEDLDSLALTNFDLELEEDASTDVEEESRTAERAKNAENNFCDRAAAVYQLHVTKYKKRFKWIRPNLFKPELEEALQADAIAFSEISNSLLQSLS